MTYNIGDTGHVGVHNAIALLLPTLIPAGNVDAAVAGYVGSSSLTSDALSRGWGRALNLESFPGVDPTGATECHAAIQSAVNAAAAAGIPLVSGTSQYNISSGVTIQDNADLSRAVFNFSGTTGVAVTIGNAAAPPTGGIVRKLIRTPYVIATAKTTTTWSQVTGTIGVQVNNTSDCTIYFGTVRNFETGIQFKGSGVGGGVTYCTFFLGTLLNNKRNLQVTSDGVSGYSNQNQTYGGVFNFDSAEAPGSTGTRHILIDNIPSPVDGWTFHTPALEDSAGVAEFTVECYGNNNLFDYARWETGTGSPSVKWQTGSTGNEIRGGVNVDAIVETIVGTGTTNRMIRNQNLKVLTAVKTFDNTDEGKTIIANVSGGGTFTLPGVVFRSPGTKITVKNINATTITVNTTTDPLDGGTTVTLAQWASKTFVAQQLPAARWITF